MFYHFILFTGLAAVALLWFGSATTDPGVVNRRESPLWGFLYDWRIVFVPLGFFMLASALAGYAMCFYVIDPSVFDGL